MSSVIIQESDIRGSKPSVVPNGRTETVEACAGSGEVSHVPLDRNSVVALALTELGAYVNVEMYHWLYDAIGNMRFLDRGDVQCFCARFREDLEHNEMSLLRRLEQVHAHDLADQAE